MENTNVKNATSKDFCVNPSDIIESIVTLTEGYGLEEGRRVFEETEKVMGFLPWWSTEVRRPVMEFFREERLREQRERHEMELAKVRASVPQQPVFINQPSATNGICLSSEEETGIGQVNVGDHITPNYYSTPLSTSNLHKS